MKTDQTRKTKTIYSEFAVTRESATITGVLSVTQRQAEDWESFRVEKREGFPCAPPNWRRLAWGSL